MKRYEEPKAIRIDLSAEDSVLALSAIIPGDSSSDGQVDIGQLPLNIVDLY